MSDIKPSLLQSMGLGGTAAMFAVNFTHPIELVKTRMQVSGNGLGATISGVMKEEGVASFWKGIVFAYGREISYTSIKLGAYAPVRDGEFVFLFFEVCVRITIISTLLC